MKTKIGLTLLVLTCFIACKKEPGIGGNGSIKGSVITKKYNATHTQLIGTFPSADQYVYIVFGDHVGYDKRIKTDYNGEFEFDFLYPGKYELYTYSADSTGNALSGQMVITRDVQLKKNESQTIQRFVVYE